ncbi:MAG: hypothetical protein LAP85_09605 [Acidobacteriia bacterium]|nr:hypothetical protein [Terriglobia bacterium]
MEPQKKIPCENCGKLFYPERPWQRFCSTHCRVIAWGRRHPRLPIAEGFHVEVVPDEPAGNPAAKERT